MKRRIYDEEIDLALKEVAAQRKLLQILKRLRDPLKRSRVMRAVIALYGMDE